MATTYNIKRGCAIAYRLFDVGDAIALDIAEELARDIAGRRLALRREGAQSIVFSAPPIDVELGARELSLAAGAFGARAFAQLFEYGAVSISYEVPIASGTDLASL